ncbi:zinc finger BED domain-containing protein 5-like, partial [Centruroides vittatus]|uniref:zinc finger BED domain-containing protein 5-like n=1 Tax=Centruroides vittatus TaxID=120091 RepID=UPI0035107ABA
MDKFLLNSNNKDSAESREAVPETSGKGFERRKRRKYDDSYLDFGFTSINENDKERPQCVLCMKVLAPECMLPKQLILPAAVDLVNIMIGESAGKLLSKVPLSNNTISRRIQHMGKDLNIQLIEKLKESEFRSQLDEATDNNKDAHLICYVRFLDGNSIVEDLLFCKSITGSTKAQDLFEILNIFMDENNLEWTKCVGVCTDGGRSMSGSYGGLQALIRNKAPDSVWTHCIIHREALASKAKTPSEFTSLEEESLIDLSCDNTLKLKFGSMELSDFWISVKEEYPLLS